MSNRMSVKIRLWLRTLKQKAQFKTQDKLEYRLKTLRIHGSERQGLIC